MDLLKDVTQSQAKAITHVEGPLLVLAGAGSGKTRVVTRRIAHLASVGVAPWNILGITFTNKAAGEMAERVKALVDGDVLICTFHSFCARMLRRHIGEGWTPDFTIFDQDDSRKLVKDVISGLNLDPRDFAPNRVHNEISRLKNAMQSPEEAAGSKFDFRGRTIARIYTAYQERLKANNALDFDDLLLKMVEIASKDQTVAASLAARFRYVLVDEFQDTNAAQYRLVKIVSSGTRNLCVTGDPDQSIYRWRGADIRNILEFEKDFPEAAVVTLEENWRSSGAILKAAGSLIKHNVKRKEKELVATHPPGRPPTLIEAADEEDEAIQIADAINGLTRERVAPSDIAVFYRTNAQSRSLETAFMAKTVPYVVVGAVEFYHRKEIKDILSYLRLAANPRDDVSFLRVVNVPARGIGDKAIAKIRQEANARGCSMFEALRSMIGSAPESKSSKTAAGFFDAVEAARAASETSVAESVAAAAASSGYAAMLESSSDPKDVDRAENIRELRAAAGSYDLKNSGKGTLRGFLEEVALVSDVDGLDERAEAVSLMTLHSSKGLEFPVVFVTGMEEGLMPHSRSADSPDELEEERRLCYVGFTRAMDRLFLSWARFRSAFGDSPHRVCSRFLKEAGTKPKSAPEAPRQDTWSSFSYEKDEDFSDPDAPYARGDKVRHSVFGKGTVVSLSRAGSAWKVEVKFAAVGRKMLRADIAGMEKI